MTIPKKIFYVWGANEPKRPEVEFCINSWKQNLPDYEIIEINEESVDYFNFQEELKHNKWFRTVYERKIYAYVSDYVRIKTLYNNGGIYLDTDVTVIKSFDDCLEEPAFIGMQGNDEDGDMHSLVEPAILGSHKYNNFLQSVVNFYEEKTPDNIWNKPFYNMPDIFNFLLKQKFGKQNYPSRDKQTIIRYQDISIFPEKYFIPYRYTESFSLKCIKEDTHTIHWFNASWVKPEIIFFLKHKHIYSVDDIDNKRIAYESLISRNNFIKNIFSIKNSINKFFIEKIKNFSKEISKNRDYSLSDFDKTIQKVYNNFKDENTDC